MNNYTPTNWTTKNKMEKIPRNIKPTKTES